MADSSPSPQREGDRHLSPRAYHALATLAGAIGLAASYVTVRFFSAAIQATERDDGARELLTLAAMLFVAAELAAFFIAGLVPAARLRALRWQLSACAAALVVFEVTAIYGSQIALARRSDSHAGADAARIEQLQASIAAQRRAASALVDAAERSQQIAVASLALRRAVGIEAEIARMAEERSRLEAARVPTTTAVFGESGMVVLALARALLISSTGLVMVGAAGALIRAARDAAAPQAGRDRPAGFGIQILPRGVLPAVPGPIALPAAAAAALMATGPAARAPAAACLPVMLPAQRPVAAAQAARRQPRDPEPPHAGWSGIARQRYERVRAAVQSGQLKPSMRAIQSAEGGGTNAARLCLAQLERDGIIERAGRGFRRVG